MPASFVVDSMRRIVFFRFSGVVTQAEMLSVGHGARTDERVKDDFDRVINLFDVTDFAVSSDNLRKLADVARGFAVRRRAFVASSPLAFGIARMWEHNMLLPPGSSQVFDNLPDAMEFLGLDRDTPWPAGA